MAKLRKFRLQAARITVYPLQEVKAANVKKAKQALRNGWKQKRPKPKKVHYSVREVREAGVIDLDY